MAASGVSVGGATGILAAASIGSGIALGTMAMEAASTSNSVGEFNDQGNWSTVAGTVIGGGIGGASAALDSKSRTGGSKPKSRGSTAVKQPANLREQLALEQVESNPYAGVVLNLKMNDSRWLASEGWVKMQQKVPTSQGDINIHYVQNKTIGIFDDFKIK